MGGENPLEEGMETQPSILAWRIPWTEVLGRLQSTVEKSQTRLKQLSMHTEKERLRKQSRRLSKRKKEYIVRKDGQTTSNVLRAQQRQETR